MTATEHAKAAAEAIRQLNHATIADNLTISEVYDTLAHLRDLCSRLPQAFDQTARAVRHRHDAGHLTLDVEGPVIAEVRGALGDLALAAVRCSNVAKSIDRALEVVSHMIDEGP